MDSGDVARIEQELEVALPTELRDFLLSPRDELDPDDCTVMDDPESIIEMTKMYRLGFVGLPPWPKAWIYIGDESDACPYFVDCVTGEMARLHKGDPRQRPLAVYESFDVFRSKARLDRTNDVDATTASVTWRDEISFWLPAAAALVVIFVIIPLCLFGFTSLIKWILK